MSSPLLPLDVLESSTRRVVRTGDGRFFAAADDVAEPAVDARIQKQASALHRQRACWTSHPATLHVVGAPEPWQKSLIAEVRHALEARGITCTTTAEPADAAPLNTDVALLLQNDPATRSRWCRRLRPNAPVTSLYREGDLWFIDPLCTSPGDPDAAQVTRRRHAASPAARELELWWDSAAPGRTTQEPDSATRAAILTRLLGMLHAHWSAGPAADADRRTLWIHDTVRGTATTHTVLGFPEPAPRPS
ncbi:hypothetical protein [Zhihengliuella halotolerans]|uniref:Uncharacterized protein n=1 Tax=Zhihengliuella halotolerans TaxID=370736 RepID=A0A4Q8AGD9_9MICC|nr:hypothetical protein [Zhihengliuella halotolerans]RZU63430.1 hypothetical protein EV380_3048 [Zhihengliuella halotolerans]